MKIAHILATLGTGGIQGFVYSLTYEQAKLGHEVIVIITDLCDTEHSFQQETFLKDNKVKVYRLNRAKGKKIQLIKTLTKCRSLIDLIKPDIINSHGTLWHLFGAVACIGKKYRQICTVHNTPEKWSGLVNFFCKNKPIICCSKAAYEGRIQKNKIAYCIENGISPYIVRTKEKTNLRHDYALLPTDKVIVSIGNLRPQKNYKNLINLAKILDGSEFHFFICGGNFGGPAYDDPSLYEGYRNLHCLGPRKDISAIENGADLFLSSSTFEGLPIAVLEAYFNGIPCVLSPIPQHIDISKVPYVWIPKDFETESFVDTIKQALESSLSHEEIYEQRKPYLEHYSITRAAKEYILAYQAVIGNERN